MKKKIQFKCDCGHLEDQHNWDAWSAYFGVCEATWAAPLYHRGDGTYEPEELHCPCNNFRADNLRFLEELHERKS